MTCKNCGAEKMGGDSCFLCNKPFSEEEIKEFVEDLERELKEKGVKVGQKTSEGVVKTVSPQSEEKPLEKPLVQGDVVHKVSEEPIKTSTLYEGTIDEGWVFTKTEISLLASVIINIILITYIIVSKFL